MDIMRSFVTNKRKGFFMKRMRVGKKAGRKLFTKTAGATRKINMVPKPMRGGISL